MKIVVVVPTIRPEQMEKFREAWKDLFTKHKVTLITVWDGEDPGISISGDDLDKITDGKPNVHHLIDGYEGCFYRFTDSCRNYGFVAAAKLNPDYILTLDDDVEPYINQPDPIQAHLDVLNKRVSLSWMNTADYRGHVDFNTFEYMRGFPYSTRNEAPVMLSHGVWSGVPDLDGETQLKHTGEGGRLPIFNLTYYNGPIPRGALFPLCGMNVMVRRDALPYLYFAPMGPDTGIFHHETGNIWTSQNHALNRFGDIWMGIFLKRAFDGFNWACYTGGSTVLHTRASDARKNMEQERLGREWNEWLHRFNTEEANLGGYGSPEFWKYLDDYSKKRKQYAGLIQEVMK